jgi:bifunctional DNA-binding transcriptional regulator/antitoxin component of YhaV-PrlF toxin-antitoxin module
MTTARVADDGQITIPKPVLEQAGNGPGTEVTFRSAADGSVLVEKVDAAAPSLGGPDRFESLRGIAGPGPSTDEIMAELRGD